MKLEQQCCSLQQAKRLKELGVKKNSIVNWYKGGNGYQLHVGDLEDIAKYTTTYPAFTVAELAEMLPDVLSGSRFGKKWSIMYRGGKKNFELIKDMGQTKFDTMAECYAAMLIHLIETGVVKP